MALVNNSFKKSTLKSLPFFFNYASLSYIFVIFNILGDHSISISLSLMQSFLSLYITAFSGDFRSLFLSESKSYLLLVKHRSLAAIVFVIIFSVYTILSSANYLLLFLLLIVRKFLDWVEEILLLKSKKISPWNSKYFIVQIFFLLPFPFLYRYLSGWLSIFFILWFFSTIYILFDEYKLLFHNFYLRVPSFRRMPFLEVKIKNQILATTFIALGNCILRLSLINYLDTKAASSLICAFTVGGFSGSLISNIFIPNLIKNYKNYKLIKSHIMTYIFFVSVISIFFISNILNANHIYKNIDLNALILTFIGGSILLLSNFYRIYLIQINKITTEKEDFLINLFLICFVLFLCIDNHSYFQYIILVTSIFSLSIYKFKTLSILNEKYFFYLLCFLYCCLFLMILIGFISYYLLVIR